MPTNPFKKMSTGLAHSPAFPGIQHGSLAQLNAVIGTEKDLQHTSQRLSGEEKKSADALREWATLDIGEDLNDVCSKVATLYERLSTAESRYGDGLGEFRTHFRTLRTQEEDFANLQKRHKDLQGKIESAEKNLAKTPSDHKEKPLKEQHLTDLKSEMVSMEKTIATEEARLGDTRRITVQRAFNSQADALLKYAESMSIVAQMTKLLVAEVPTAQLQPGAPRPDYGGHSNTARILQDATSKLDAAGTHTTATAPSTTTGATTTTTAAPPAAS